MFVQTYDGVEDVHVPRMMQLRLFLGDMANLAKLRLSMLVICTTAVGLVLAPHRLVWWRTFLTLFAVTTVVAAANALNCYLEIDVDARMQRTCMRPLPRGRMDARVVLWGSHIFAALSATLLYYVANPTSALLAFIAFALYGWVYTPMKRHSWLAVFVGAIPGAVPPLLGFVAATNILSSALGWSLFALLFIWQIPHFFAIAVCLKDDYARGGLKVLPMQCSARYMVVWTTLATACVLPVSILPLLLTAVSVYYIGFALCIGGLFIACTARGFWMDVSTTQGIRWGRQVFLASIVYLALLLGAFIIATLV